MFTPLKINIETEEMMLGRRIAFPFKTVYWVTFLLVKKSLFQVSTWWKRTRAVIFELLGLGTGSYDHDPFGWAKRKTFCKKASQIWPPRGSAWGWGIVPFAAKLCCKNEFFLQHQIEDEMVLCEDTAWFEVKSGANFCTDDEGWMKASLSHISNSQDPWDWYAYLHESHKFEPFMLVNIEVPWILWEKGMELQ